MATNTLFISVVGSGTTTGLVAVGTDTNARDVTLTTTGAVYVIFDDVTGTANASLNSKPLVLAAGNIINLPNVVMSKCFIRSQITSTTAASMMWYTP
jgi:hypothetical protein